MHRVTVVDYENGEKVAVEVQFEGETVRKKFVALKSGRCKFCEDLDRMYEVVCYLPHDSGHATDIPINYCPNCGARMDGE